MTIEQPVDQGGGPSDQDGRRATVAIWIGIAAGVLAVALIGTAWVRQTIERATDPSNTTPGVTKSTAAGSPSAGQTADPSTTIPGTRTTDLTTWWSTHWQTTFRYVDGRTRSATVQLSTGGGQITISAVQPSEDVLGWPHQVRCGLNREGLAVDRADLGLLVTECLGPVLQDQERQDVPAWLDAHVMGLPVGELRAEEFSRFDLLADRPTAASLTLTLQAR